MTAYLVSRSGAGTGARRRKADQRRSGHSAHNYLPGGEYSHPGAGRGALLILGREHAAGPLETVAARDCGLPGGGCRGVAGVVRGAGSGGGAAADATAATATGPVCAPGPASAGSAGSSPQGQIIGGQLNAVAARPAAGAWAAGRTSPGNPLAAHWDGSAWASVPTSIGDHLTSPSGGYFNGVAVVSAGDAWAVGAGAYNKALVEHWDGTAWSPAPAPDPEGRTIFEAVAATSADDAWAVGEDFDRPVIVHWNGTAWTLVPSPAPRAGELSPAWPPPPRVTPGRSGPRAPAER